MSDVATAHKNLLAAEAKITEAERNRDEAAAQLDQALAARGWQRVYGGFDAKLYSNRGGEAQPLERVLGFETEVTA
jgi:hypothetical protein